MEEQIKLIPNWKFHQRLIYQIDKTDNFHYKGGSSKANKRTFDIELTQNNEKVFEAFFPKSILFPVKLLNIIDEKVYDNTKISSRTFYYEVDENLAFNKLLNLKEIISSLKSNVKKLKKIIKEKEQREEFGERIDIILESEEKIEKYLLEDIINIHYNNGLDIKLGYYFDLKEESVFKRILKPVFKKSKFFLNKINFIKFDSNNDFLIVEYLKGTENLSSKIKMNWSAIENDFNEDDFDVLDYRNITLYHEKYLYTKKDMLLHKYCKKHIIDSPIMRKEIINTIHLKK